MRLALGLLLSLVACGSTPSTQDSDSGAPGPDPLASRWMADVFPEDADIALGRILIPGGFNSSSFACDAANGISPDSPEAVLAFWGPPDSAGSTANRERIVDWARTQGMSLGQQLEAGIRFIEINLTLREGVVTTWHSVYGLPVTEVLEEVVAFASTHPDEVVVLHFGLSIDPAAWSLFADAVSSPLAGGIALCDLVYDGPEDAALARLSDIRASGRNVVWAPQGELRDFLLARGDCPLSAGDADRSWSITVSPEGVEEALAASVDSRDPAKLLINDFVFSLGGSENVAEQVGYIGNYEGVQEVSVALGFAGDFPERLIESFDAQGNMNIFAGAWIEDSNLVEAAIARNRSR